MFSKNKMGKKEITVNGFKITYKEEDAEAMKKLFGASLEEEAKKLIKEKARKKNAAKKN